MNRLEGTRMNFNGKAIARHLIMAVGTVVISIVSTEAKAQVNDSVYKMRYQISPEKKGELYLDINTLSFFRDNEFSTPAIKGYTLPGVRVQPKLVYYPLKNIKLELGAHVIRYWGAEKYPNVAFRDIATWKRSGHQDAVHALPFFRAHVAMTKNLDVVLGNLYGGITHNIIEPLYTPELDLTADPEAGVQLLYHTPALDIDTWVNWESFIFRSDNHQEAFLFGLTSKVKLNNENSRFHFYIPIQALAHHKGGEIDTLETSTVRTMMNGAAGVGMRWNTGHKTLRRITLESFLLGYYQQKGEEFPYSKGSAVYGHAAVDFPHFRIDGGYYHADRFLSVMGMPFYGSMSIDSPVSTFDKTGLWQLGIDYYKTFAPGFALGANADVYFHGPVTAVAEDGMRKEVGSSTSFSFGVYLRINPSFLLKKFGK